MRAPTIRQCLAAGLVMGMLSQGAIATGATYYVDKLATGCSVPSDTDYNPATRSCGSGSDDVYNHTTISSMPVVGGDTVYVRADTYTTAIAVGSKAGTAGNYISIEAYPDEVVTIRPSGAVNSVTSTGAAQYIKIKGFVIDGINQATEFGLNFTLHQHFWTFENNDIKNQNNSALQIAGNGWIIRGNKIHDTAPPSGPGTGFYCIYFGEGADGLIENNELHHCHGGGIQAYPGDPIPITNLVIRNNEFHHVSTIEDDIGAILIAGNNRGTKIYNNYMHHNGGSFIYGFGVNIYNANKDTLIYNNVMYANTGYGVRIRTTGSTGTQIINNIMIDNARGALFNAGSPITNTNNRTTGVITDCTISTTDLRLKAGTNPCRDAGTSTIMRPAPVGVTDIGAYEQGTVASAAVVGGFIEATIDVMTPGVQPTSGITGWSVTCVGCTGSPVVSSASVKPGANNIVILSVTGITTPGTCTISYTNGNMTDSSYVGPVSNGLAQFVDNRSGLSVAGTCANSAGGGGGPTGGLLIHHDMNEGTGTTLNDLTANNLDSTTSGSPTWVTPAFEGAGLSFAAGVDQRVNFAWGNAINPTTQSFTLCAWVKPIANMGNRIVMGTPNGTNQRMYIGSFNGQTWQIGVGASGQSSTQTEFQVATTWTHLCLTNDASVDTVYLSVNGVRGTSAQAVKSSASVTSLAGNFMLGCGHFSGTILCGGFTIDHPKIWDVALSSSELLTEYQSFTPSSGGEPCYTQSAYQAESPFTTSTGTPVVLPLKPDGSIDVVQGGAVAFKIDIKCTGSAGVPLAIRPYYSTDGTTFTQPIPDVIGDGGISMFGVSVLTPLNSGVSTGCVDATGLTPNNGSTVLVSTVTPTATLAQDHCISHRVMIRVGHIVGQSRTIRWHQDNGAVLAGSYPATLPKINVVSYRANTGP